VKSLPILSAKGGVVIDKTKILSYFEEQEIVGPLQLANFFGMRYKWATRRIERLSKQGLIEPLTNERGRWALSVKGTNTLNYLRRRNEDDGTRKGIGARGTGS